MIIAHVSDTHGKFPPIPKSAEIVISSGDDLPNTTRGNEEVEPYFQRVWINANVENYKKWLDGRTFIRCAGNHDFCPMLCPTLTDANIPAIDVTNNYYVFNELGIYGFPYIPYINGEWKFESTVSDMSRHVRRLKDILVKNKIDILVAHAPIANILDFAYGDHIGNPQIKDLFEYMLEEKHLPKLYAHGHAHENYGTELIGNMLISNAATTVNFIKYDPSSGFKPI